MSEKPGKVTPQDSPKWTGNTFGVKEVKCTTQNERKCEPERMWVGTGHVAGCRRQLQLHVHIYVELDIGGARYCRNPSWENNLEKKFAANGDSRNALFQWPRNVVATCN